MSYQIAGIDVHKKMLAVVVADVHVDGEYQFTHRKVGTSPAELRALADWLLECDVKEVVMESTAQYWRPVWETLEWYWKPQRRSRKGASGSVNGGNTVPLNIMSNCLIDLRDEDAGDVVAAEHAPSISQRVIQRIGETGMCQRAFEPAGCRFVVREYTCRRQTRVVNGCLTGVADAAGAQLE